MLSLLFTFLVIGETNIQLEHSIPGIPNDDAFQSIYLHNMVHQSIFDGNIVFWDSMQFFPYGYHVPSTNGGNYLEMFASGILRMCAPWPNWYGYAHFIWIPINILCFVPLGVYLWRSKSLAFSIGCAWATLPYTLSFISYGRLTQSVQFAIPLALLGFLHMKERQSGKTPFILGLSLALCAWSYWYFAIFLLLLSPFFLIPTAIQNGVHTTAKQFLTTLFVMLLCIAPLCIMVYYPLTLGYSLPPPPISTLSISPIFPDAIRLFGDPQTENILWTLFPIPIWIFALLGTLKGHRKKTWLGLSCTCILFSMGPALLYNGLIWFLPYYPFWKTIPLLDRLLHPDRWLLIGGIFICILTGEGYWFMTQKLPWKRVKMITLYASMLIPIWSILEARHKGELPIQTWEQTVPSIWKEAKKETGGLIIVPIMRSQRSTQFQHVHQRPILGGMVENQPWTYSTKFKGMMEGNGLIMDLFSRNDGNAKDLYVFQADIDELVELGYTQILFSQDDWNHLNHPQTQRMDMIRILTKAFGEPVFTSKTGDAIWNIPKKGKKGRSPAAGSSIQNIGPADPVPEGAPPI